MNLQALGADAAKVAPLGFATTYLNFVSTYGTAIVTTLTIFYSILTAYLRIKDVLDKKKATTDVEAS